MSLGGIVLMSTQLQPQPVDYAKAIAMLVAQMSLERAVQVYEYVRFLESQPTYPPPIKSDDEDWLNDTEEQLQAEDTLWEAASARHREQFAAFAAAARTEIASGTAQPMFTDEGEFAVQ